MRDSHAPEAVRDQERWRATREHVFVQPRHPRRSRWSIPIVLLDAHEIGMASFEPGLPVVRPRVGPARNDEDKGGGGQFRGILCPVRASAVSKLLMRRSCFVVACALLTVAGLSAQERPNFSGEWVRVEPTPDVRVSLTIVQDGAFIRIEQKARESLPGVRPGIYRVGLSGGVEGYTTDIYGSTRQWSWGDHEMTVHYESWVVHRGQTRGSRHEEIWSLGADDRLVIAITHQPYGDAPTTTRLVYERKR